MGNREFKALVVLQCALTIVLNVGIWGYTSFIQHDIANLHNSVNALTTELHHP